MTSKNLRVIFLGSPESAVPSLEAVAQRFEIPLVVTQPDRQKGRGRRLLPTPVRARAEEMGLSVLPAHSVNSAEALGRIKAVAADVMVVVSFGQILREHILAGTPFGCINLHFSLLPRLRGAAPVPWAIIGGLERTGVSLMRVTARMDAGPVFVQDTEAILPSDTAGDLYARLACKGARLLAENLADAAHGVIAPLPQDESLATYAPRITREDTAIDWTKGAAEVDRRIRGLSGQMEAFALFHGTKEIRVNLYRSAVVDGESPGPGVALRSPSGALLVGCGEDLVEIVEIQAQGRKRLTGRDFANGCHIKGGEVFTSSTASD